MFCRLGSNRDSKILAKKLMNIFLPFFPLNLVAFPTEKLNLHIFEPRYRQLIRECIDENKTFGIPAYLNNKVKPIGTEMKVLELSNLYPDGRMDIKTEGIRAFRALSFKNPIPEKMYSGGEIEFLENDFESDWMTRTKTIEMIDKLYEILNIGHPFDYSKEPLSFQVAHKIGFSLDQEYQLLEILDEIQRLEFIIEHLEKTLPVVEEVERTKQLVKMNGHFKNLNPLQF
jgi:hypothetical protein